MADADEGLCVDDRETEDKDIAVVVDVCPKVFEIALNIKDKTKG